MNAKKQRDKNRRRASKLARQAGVKYNNGANTVTYFGAVACHPGLLEA